jgi:SAM-dependent methyltransferase
MPSGSNTGLQQAFFASGEHAHLRPDETDRYSRKLAARMVAAAGIGADDRVLEIGASFGRFSFELLRYCGALVAVDLSDRALAELDAERERRGVPLERCRTVCGDARIITATDVGDPVDFAVGLFILHHIPDYEGAIRNVSRLVRPGGRVAFLEPNRRNPLFLAQVLACKDMSWEAEKDLFNLSEKKIVHAYEKAGLTQIRCERLGFFPPQIINRFAWSRALEERIEAAGVFSPVLPFLLITATV